MIEAQRFETQVAEADARADLERKITRLVHGDVLPVHEIESALGVIRGTEAYELACLKLRGSIEHEFRRREPPVRVIIRQRRDQGLVVLTHTDASAAASRKAHLARQKQRAMTEVLRSQPRALIADGYLQTHDREVEVNGRITQAMDREVRRRQEPKPPPPRARQTPTRR